MVKKFLLWLLGILPFQSKKNRYFGAYRTPGDIEIEPIEPIKPIKPIKPKQKPMSITFRDFENVAIPSFFMMCVVAVVGLIGYMTVKSVTASGEVNYCYVESHQTMRPSDMYYTLEGNRDWRTDRTMARFQRFEEAVAAAKLINCNIEKR